MQNDRVWLCQFISKPTLHPDRHVQIDVVVEAKCKRTASQLGKKELQVWEGCNSVHFKRPFISALPDSRGSMRLAEYRKNRAIVHGPQPTESNSTSKDNGHGEAWDGVVTELESLIATKQAKPSASDLESEIEALNNKLDALLPNESYCADDIPNDVYHGAKGDSSTKLKDSCLSMMYYNNRYNLNLIEQPKGTHFDVGNLAHAMILEPHNLSKRFIKKPDIPYPTEPQRTKYDNWVKLGRPSKEDDVKAMPSDIAIQRCEFWDRHKSENERVTIVDSDNWKIAEEMTAAVMADPVASKILNNKHRKSERSYFTRHAETGRIIKCRTDIDVGSIIGDVKTIALKRKVDEEYLLNVLRSEIYNRKYHLSAAMYLDITGATQFVWVFVNKEPSYHWVAVVRASDEIIQQGHILYTKQLDKIQRSEESQSWPPPVTIQRVFNPETHQFEIPVI